MISFVNIANEDLSFIKNIDLYEFSKFKNKNNKIPLKKIFYCKLFFQSVLWVMFM